MEEWKIFVTSEFRAWHRSLDDITRGQIVDAIDQLADVGPTLGRPLVDRVQNSSIHNMKELRPASIGSTEVRILFVFDPWRAAILLTGGDKSGNWSGWYREAIPRAEQLYQQYLHDRQEEADRKEGDR